MNNIYNISDCYINISLAEGFGLGTLEAMQAGTPIIALKTGGMTRQVVDHRDGSENGVALPVEFKALVGSQHVPYIYEDYVKQETVANGLMKLYDMGDEKRRELGQKARNYVLSEFSYQKTVDLWHDSLEDTIQNWKSRYNKIHMETL
jgi:glycosyltransferase involved in cell wall biosynthesis